MPSLATNPIFRGTLLVLFAAVHLSFYVSVLFTDHLQTFYPRGTIQDEKTLDYSQIPNGARTFFEGGSIVGAERDYPTLPNVYHPVTTLLLGGLLQLVGIQAGFLLFTLTKLVITALLFHTLHSTYGESPYFLPAAFVFFTFFGHGIDISTGQYHFLLNLFLFLLLYGLLRGKSEWNLSANILGSLLIKPIALLWIPLLVLRKRYLTLAAVGFFMLLTAAGYFLIPGGDFYVKALDVRFVGTTHAPSVTEEVVYNLEAVGMFLTGGSDIVNVVKYVLGVALLGSFFVRRLTIFDGVFFCCCYYLLFYAGVYEYHYTTLVPLFTLGLLTRRWLQSRFAITWIVLACLPSPYFVFKALGWFSIPEEAVSGLPSYIDPARTVTAEGFFVLLLVKVVPVLVLATYGVVRMLRSRPGDAPDAKPALQ